MEEKTKYYHYKLTHHTDSYKETIYARCNIPIKPEKLKDIMGLENYMVELCTKEEYEQNTN